MIFLNSVFHESIVPMPKSNPQKYFRKCFRFCGDIHKKFFFIAISGIQNPEVAQPPGIVTQRLHTLRSMIPGGFATSGYCNLDILQHPGNNTQKLLEKNLHE